MEESRAEKLKQLRNEIYQLIEDEESIALQLKLKREQYRSLMDGQLEEVKVLHPSWDGLDTFIDPFDAA